MGAAGYAGRLVYLFFIFGVNAKTRNMKKLPLFITCFLLTACTSLFAQENKWVIAGNYKPAMVIEQLKKDIPEWMKQMSVPGMTIALVHKGKLVWQQNFGFANADTKQPVTNESVFDAASLTKVVTAYAVLKLVDAGKLNLDTPLNKYLGHNYDVPNDARINLITARRVLSHTAGFPNWRQEGAATLPIDFNPGEKYSYSGEGFVYLSKVAEQITKMKFEDYVKQSVFEPLHMNNSSFIWLDSFSKRQVYRHDWLGGHPWRWEGSGSNAAASMRTTATDYARFVIALMNGEGLKKKTWQEMLTPQIKVDDKFPEVAWGLGVGLETTSDAKCFWHWGDQGNSKCYMTAFVKQKNAVIYFANGRNGLSFVREVLHDAIGGAHPAPDWLNYERYNPATNILFQAVIDKGAPAALETYRQQRKQNSEQNVSEAAINRIGYMLLQMKRTDDAIAVLEQNTVDFPQSGNTWDSLAEAYMIKGDKEAAIRYYEKSLTLDPNNTNAVELLKKLRGN